MLSQIRRAAFWCWASIILGVGSLIAPPAEGGFTITDLGVIGPGLSSDATGINASGATSGTISGSTPSSSARSVAGGGFVAIDTSALPGATSNTAAAISASNEVVGTFYDNIDKHYHAYMTSNGRALDAGSFVGAKYVGADSWGVAVNSSNEMLGTARLKDGSEIAFRSAGGGQIIPIAMPGGSQVAQAAGINSSGTVVGSYINALGVSRIFIDQEGLGATDLLSQYNAHSFGGNTYASAINDRGDVTGYGDFNGQSHAFFASSKGTLTDIGVTGGYSSSMAIGMNNLGQVVGNLGSNGGASHAFLWDQTAGLFDLNSLLSPADQTKWILTSATGINDSDQIAGQGYINGQLHGFVLTLTPGSVLFAPLAVVPAPPSAWMALAGLALTGGCAWVRRERTAAPGTA